MVRGTTEALTLEMVKIAEIKMLPTNAKIHSQKHIDKIVKPLVRGIYIKKPIIKPKKSPRIDYGAPGAILLLFSSL